MRVIVMKKTFTILKYLLFIVVPIVVCILAADCLIHDIVTADYDGMTVISLCWIPLGISQGVSGIKEFKQALNKRSLQK